MAKGFTQKEGIYYHDTFSPVIKLNTVRSIVSFGVKPHWKIHKAYVNIAFLHEEVFMKLPLGFLSSSPSLVCKLNKSLYGLKQDSR